LCARAGQAGLDLCRECDEELPRMAAACSVCALQLPVEAAASLCGACLRRRPVFEASHVPFRYDYPIDHLIQAFKYGGQEHCGRVLGSLLARHLCASRADSWPEVLVPVPLAPRRYRQRGFNQAIELARSLRGITQLAVRTDLLARTRETAEQASLDRKARRRNVRGAFDLTRPLTARHVAILDDVVTTTSTVSELAKLLRRAGARRIEVWAIARASAVSGK
jgi:ComF family protein